jgi:hypothetical protein
MPRCCIDVRGRGKYVCKKRMDGVIKYLAPPHTHTHTHARTHLCNTVDEVCKHTSSYKHTT